MFNVHIYFYWQAHIHEFIIWYAHIWASLCEVETLSRSQYIWWKVEGSVWVESVIHCVRLSEGWHNFYIKRFCFKYCVFLCFIFLKIFFSSSYLFLPTCLRSFLLTITNLPYINPYQNWYQINYIYAHKKNHLFAKKCFRKVEPTNPFYPIVIPNTSFPSYGFYWGPKGSKFVLIFLMKSIYIFMNRKSMFFFRARMKEDINKKQWTGTSCTYIS